MVLGVKLTSLQFLVNRNSKSSGCPTISGVNDYARVESNGNFADHVLVSGMLWLRKFGFGFGRFWQKVVCSF